ncbi:MAG: T9SS type A sorting domain-containing protein, partial [Flavobacteriales bacterium]|nr:T9SS type A sorting domain-containing protein [Flavobacteriales bacterium]
GSFTWIDGNTYTTSNNTATYTLTNAAGCDSIVTLNLTINNTYGTDIQSACNSFTWIDGNTYTTSNNTATHTLTNAAGCDSIVTLNLTINSLTNLGITSNSTTIMTSNMNATYQWLDCDNNYDIILGETSSSFTASINGNYAVELTENGCTDTTNCITINSVGTLENTLINYSIYPNPTKEMFILEISTPLDANLVIYDTFGKLVSQIKLTSTFQKININNLESGAYYVDIQHPKINTELKKLFVFK